MSDNFYENCPPIMSDNGRYFAFYDTATTRHITNRREAGFCDGVVNNHAYRTHLQKSTNNSLLTSNRGDKCEESTKKCYHSYPLRSTVFQYEQEKLLHDAKCNENLACDTPASWVPRNSKKYSNMVPWMPYHKVPMYTNTSTNIGSCSNRAKSFTS